MSLRGKLVKWEGTSTTLGRKTLEHLLKLGEKKSSCFTQWEECGYYSSLVTAKYKAETSTCLYAEVSILHLIVSDAEKQFKISNRFYNHFWRWDDALLPSVVIYSAQGASLGSCSYISLAQSTCKSSQQTPSALANPSLAPPRHIYSRSLLAPLDSHCANLPRALCDTHPAKPPDTYPAKPPLRSPQHIRAAHTAPALQEIHTAKPLSSTDDHHPANPSLSAQVTYAAALLTYPGHQGSSLPVLPGHPCRNPRQLPGVIHPSKPIELHRAPPHPQLLRARVQ